MPINRIKLEKAKGDAKLYYSSLKKISCPYLHEEVHFNSEGFEHLLTRSWNRGRSETEQYTRLRLLTKAVEVIQKSHLMQEHSDVQLFIRQSINSRWEKQLKRVIYFVFVAVYPQSGLRIKVVVKQIEGGRPF